MLYTAHSRVGRGNIMLRHFVPHLIYELFFNNISISLLWHQSKLPGVDAESGNIFLTDLIKNINEHSNTLTRTTKFCLWFIVHIVVYCNIAFLDKWTQSNQIQSSKLFYFIILVYLNIDFFSYCSYNTVSRGNLET